MSRRPAIARSRNSKGAHRRSPLPGPREFLAPLARILNAAGCAPEVLEREFSAICRTLKKPTRPFEPLIPGYVADLSHVIARWHADEQYLDAEGCPNALPLKGPGPSLEELILKVLPDVDPARAVQSLIELEGVRREGRRYLPTDRYLALNRQPLAVWAHGLTAVLGVLTTVEHNVSAPPAKRLIERVAINPRFPVRALPQLHSSLKSEVPETLSKLDLKMLRDEVCRESDEYTRVGIGFYVFEDPQVTGAARRNGRNHPRSRNRIAHRRRRG